MGSYVNASPKALRDLAEQIKDSTQTIINECRSLEGVINELRPTLDSTTYSRVDGILTQIEPSVKSATEHARVLHGKVSDYAQALERVQKG